MLNKLTQCISENKLSPFSIKRTIVKSNGENIFKTKDAKTIASKTITTLSKNFTFPDTTSLWSVFSFTTNNAFIKERQEFFAKIKESQETINTSFLSKIQKPKPFWHPPYSTIVVTEDESTFAELQKLDCLVKFLISQHDVESLEGYDLVQAIDCDKFKLALEQLPQSMPIDLIEDIFLERHIRTLSGWKENIELLSQNKTNHKITTIIEQLKPLFELFNTSKVKTLNIEEIESALIKINAEISNRIKDLSISGNTLFEMLSKQKFPPEIEKITRDAIAKTEYPLELFETGIPVKLDQEEIAKRIALQKANEFTDRATTVRSHATTLKKIQQLLRDLETELLLFDFTANIKHYINNSTEFPRNSQTLSFKNSSNIFLDRAQPISFYLSENYQCSILTGANSGGKTTLLEHLIQLLVIHQLGLPTIGTLTSPMFSEIYYFAKNKGSMSKGAFETLLAQMDQINPGQKTLILADEIEAVTEPGVAGKMICATAEYFIQKGCYVVIATHLGQEIAKSLPSLARIDGIEAKGLDENFELLVDHNPVLGRLAHSTPELIVEKMANAQKTPYFAHLHEALKKSNQTIL